VEKIQFLTLTEVDARNYHWNINCYLVFGHCLQESITVMLTHIKV